LVNTRAAVTPEGRTRRKNAVGEALNAGQFAQTGIHDSAQEFGVRGRELVHIGSDTDYRRLIVAVKSEGNRKRSLDNQIPVSFLMDNEGLSLQCKKTIPRTTDSIDQPFLPIARICHISMEVQVLDLFGACLPIVVPNSVVKVDDLRIALFSQHNLLPEHFVFSYDGSLLDEDSSVPLPPGSEIHPFIMIDSAQFPQKAFAAVDHAFQFGSSRYVHYFQKPDPWEHENEERRLPRAALFDDENEDDEEEHRFGPMIRAIMRGRRRRDEPEEYDDVVLRLARVTHTDPAVVMGVYDTVGRDELLTLHLLQNRDGLSIKE
jgi:hypothetical protein